MDLFVLNNMQLKTIKKLILGNIMYNLKIHAVENNKTVYKGF